MTTALSPGAALSPAEVDQACRRLRELLAGPAGAGPQVVPLGATDALGPGRDPYADRRPGALVHLARDAVLIGPWGGPPPAERACGQCLCTVVPGLLPIDFGWSRQRAPHMPRLTGAFARAGRRGTGTGPGPGAPRRVPHPFP